LKNPHTDIPAAVLLRRQIELISHRKTQKEIAHQAGFVNANMISLLKNGSSKIPLDRVPDLALTIEVEPAHLMRIALEQSIGKPAALSVLEVFGTPTTASERHLLEEIRKASGDTDPKMTARSRTALRAIFEK